MFKGHNESTTQVAQTLNPWNVFFSGRKPEGETKKSPFYSQEVISLSSCLCKPPFPPLSVIVQPPKLRPDLRECEEESYADWSSAQSQSLTANGATQNHFSSTTSSPRERVTISVFKNTTLSLHFWERVLTGAERLTQHKKKVHHVSQPVFCVII